jgi:hypothetical protein
VLEELEMQISTIAVIGGLGNTGGRVAERLDGCNSPVMNGIGRTLRRQPKDFFDYARQTAATGIWSAQS